jgi:hypothetical protein
VPGWRPCSEIVPIGGTFTYISTGLVLGGLLGYFAGTYVACMVYEAGNLCGLVGVFVTGPVGAVLGAFTDWWASRRG